MSMKGVILCAGKGKRMQPFSATTPKAMLPVVNRPLIAYCLDKMINVGISEIAVVVHPDQHPLIQYLDNYPVKTSLFHQTEPLGIAHALLQVKSFIGEDPFLLLLGDNLIAEPIETMIKAFHGNEGSILLSAVEKPSDYGVAEITANQVVRLVEKPIHPPSNLAVIGMYLFSPIIFQAVQAIQPSARGEYEITDAIQWLIEHGYPISYSITTANYTDVGTIDRWLIANEWMLGARLNSDIRIGQLTTLENCTLRGPLIIGDHCHLKNAVIGPYVSIGDHAQLDSCIVNHSICLDYTQIKRLSRPIVNSVLGHHSTLYGEFLREQTVKLVLGDHSILSIPE